MCIKFGFEVIQSFCIGNLILKKMKICVPSRLQAAAMAKFEEVKEQTATGLAHAIEHHKFMDIKVDLQPSHIIIPHKGFYRR